MNTFMEERYRFYDEIEMQRERKRILEGNKGAISFDEYKRMKESKGEKVSDELNKLYNNNS
jgi:hypothetical protein